MEYCHWCEKPIMASDSFCIVWGRLAFHINNLKCDCHSQYMAWLKGQARRVIGEHK